jgi:putative salt-induced outer membrane protein
MACRMIFAPGSYKIARVSYSFIEGESLMRLKQILATAAGFLAMACAASADTVVLKNGDHLTGTVETSDGKNVTLKTDFAGEIQIQWSAIAEIKTDKPIFVVMPDKSTVSGIVTTEGSNIVVHPVSGPPVQLAVSQVTVVRGEDQQTAYEKSLHPGILEAWKGGINLGFALARGNSETTNLTTGFTADRKTMNDEITAYFTSLYSTNDKTGGGTIANSIVGGIKYDRNITKRVFVFGSGDFTHDELQFLDVRAIYSGGLGYHLINNPNTTLDVLAGVNYTHESYSAGNAIGSVAVSRNLAGVTVGESGMHKFGKSTTATEVFYFYPDLSNTGQYRFSFDAASVTRINKWFGWQIGLSDRYVSDPPILGTKANDIIFTTGVNFSFAH